MLQTAATSKMMSRRKKILIGSVAALAILVGIGVLHHYRVKGAVERYKAELSAQGELLDWRDIVAAPLAPKDNSASLFISLSARLPQRGALSTNHPTGMTMIAPGKATAGWAAPWVGVLGLQYTNSWRELLADYESQRELLKQFHQLTGQCAMDFNLDYSLGARVSLTHLASSKSCALRLGGASTCELHLGNSTAALLHLRAILALAKGSEREPLLISQLVRIAIANIAGSYTWDLLQAEGLEDSELETLQTSWSDLDFFPSMEQALLMERCVSLQTIMIMRESPDEYRALTTWTGGPFAAPGGGSPGSGNIFERGWQAANEGLDRTKEGVSRGAWKTSWSYTDELNMLRGAQAYLEVARCAVVDGFASNALNLEQRSKAEGRIREDEGSFSFLGGIDAAGLRTMFSDGIAISSRVFSKVVAAEANVRLAIAAIALDRYRLRHGDYPEGLEDLVPGFVSAVPRDPVDGKPLRYQSLPEGRYLLYSIGQDLVDDGGNPNRPDAEEQGSVSWIFGRDWVWPRPASVEEVQTYWETEIDGSFDHLTGQLRPEPEFLMDTNTGLPVLDPETWEFVIDPSSTNTPPGNTVKLSGQEWQDFVQRLARQWTDQYFRTLTNSASIADDLLQ